MLNRRTMAVSAGSGFAAIAAMSGLFFGTSQAFPFFLGNVGDFQIASDDLVLDDFELLLAVDENSGTNGSGMPSGELRASTVTLSNLTLQKSLNVSSVIGDIPEAEWVFNLQSGSEVKLNQMSLYSSGLCASALDATNMTLDGKGADTASFLDDFSIAADQMILRDGAIQATYLSTAGIAFQDIAITITPGGYDKPDCAP